MGNKVGVRHYFAEGLTTRGYISLLPNMVLNWRQIFVLLGGPGTGKSTMIKLIGLELLDRGYDVDFLRSAQDPDSMAGLVLPETGFAMLDAMEVTPLRWRCPGVVERFVDFTVFCDERKLQKHTSEIMAAVRKMQDLQQGLEEELINELDKLLKDRRGKNRPLFEQPIEVPGLICRLNLKKEQTGPWPLALDAIQQLQKSEVSPCFLHGLTAEGWLNLAPHFLTDFDQIRLEGEETSDALNWVLREAQQLGQVIEIVLHPLNPDEVIGIVFPERHLAIWQGNPENLKDQGLEQPFSEKLKETLVAWQNQRSLLRSIYMDSVDFSLVDEFRETMLNQVLRDLISEE